MSAVDEIQAAIEKLTAERAASTQGLWHRNKAVPRWVEFTRELGDGSSTGTVTEAIWTSADAQLIVTLHATIDAQLSILRGELLDMAATNRPVWSDCIILARAINGATS